jgi:hypothetical protein
MSVSRTTLAIPMEFREKLNEHRGENDMERLKRWAAEYEGNDLETVVTEERVREIVEEMM